MSFTEVEQEGFSSESMPLRVISYRNSIQAVVVYEMWDTVYIYTRAEFGIFDLFSDIGGL